MITLRAPQRDRAVPVAEPRRRPDLRVVTRPDDGVEPDVTRRTASGVVSTLLVVLLFACVFGVVVFQVFLVQTQSHLDDLGAKLATEEAMAKQLRLDTAELESPDRILRDSQNLQMISPGEIAFLSPKPDDDLNARFDPTKESVPVPTTVPTTPAYPGARNATSTPTVTSPSTPTTAKPTPTTAKPTPTTAKPTPTTPTTAKPTPTTAKPTPTTAKPTPTTAKPTPTTAAGPR